MDLEELLAKIAELTNAVKENNGLNGLRKDELVADFQKLLDERDQKLLEQMPARKGEQVEIPEIPHDAEKQVKGRYAPVVRSLIEHGEGYFNGTKINAVDLAMAKALMERAVATGQAGAKLPSDDLVSAVKSMSTTGAGSGAELVPENLAGELWQDMFVASRVYADLPEQVMTSDPMDIGMLAGLTFRKGTQNTATTATDPATSECKLTTTEMVAEVDWSYSLDEDSVIAMMPTLRQIAARDGAAIMDAFALNADATNAATGNINLDDANPDDDSYYLTNGQDGIRHQFIVDNSSQAVNVNGAIDDGKMASILAKLGKYALDYENCRLVPDVQTYLAMLGMTNVATVDKYGSAATLVRGELARYRGIPIIPCAAMPRTEADGKVSATAASNVKGQLAAYHRLMWRRGQRRGLTIEVDRDIKKRQMIMVVSFRIAVGCRGADRSTEIHTAGGINIT